jgi:hypothetical protein
MFLRSNTCPLVGLALLLISMSITACASDFVVTENLHYKGGVDLSEFGVRKNALIGESSLLPAKTSDALAPATAIGKALDGLVTGPLPTVIDVERWPSDGPDAALRKANLTKLANLLATLHRVRPERKFGYYSVLPSRVYWPLVDPKQHMQKVNWEQANEQGGQALGPLVDAVFPSLYTFYKDQEGWRIYATATLRAAKNFGKPVYCYLWPQFHDSNRELRGQYLPVEFWRLELEICKANANGIVIWNHAPDLQWDPKAPWWQETLSFLRKYHISP